MASIGKMETAKDGRRYWRIFVSRGYGQSPYSCRFYWPTKKDGSPVARSTAESQRDKRAVEFQSECEAGLVLTRKQEKEKAAAAEAEAARIRTLRQYSEQVFMPAKTITCAEKTRRYYQNALDNHLLPEFGDLQLQEITSAQLTAFFLRKQSSALSHSTVLGIYVTANQLFQMAYLDDTISRNPLDKVKRPRQKKDDKKRTEPERFTEEEVREIKKHLAGEPLKWQAMVQIFLSTGMRRGEVCALTWDKVDFKKKEILVDGSLGYTPEKGIFREKPKTEAGVRRIPMTGDLVEVLGAYKAEQEEAVRKRTERLKKDKKPLEFKKISIPEYVFTAKGSSDPIHPDAVNRYFSRFSSAYGIKEFHPHKLRHTAISIMLDNGVPVLIVAAIAGHDDPNVTLNTYAHASAKGMKAAISTLEAATKLG